MPGKGNGLAGFLRWSFQYILRGPVVLYKVEIRRRKFFQGMPKISHHGDGLQEDFGQDDCGSDIQVNASTIELSSHTTEEAKITVAGLAGVASGCLRMSVDDVGA